MLKPNAILETVLYVDNLEVTAKFYRDVLALTQVFSDTRMVALKVSEENFLLLFEASATTEPVKVGDGEIPPHDGSGPTHVAFSVNASEINVWRKRLHVKNVKIESTVNWPSGSTSIYFRDPDNHLVELATSDLWVC